MLAFAKLILEIEGGSKIDLDPCRGTAEQWGKLCEHLHAAERAGSGLFEATRGCLYLHVGLRPDEENPAIALRNAMREKIIGQLKAALDPPTAASAKRRRSGMDTLDDYTGFGSHQRHPNAYAQSEASERASAKLDTPSSTDGLPHLFKKQRIGTAPTGIFRSQICPDQMPQSSQEQDPR